MTHITLHVELYSTFCDTRGTCHYLVRTAINGPLFDEYCDTRGTI